MLWFLEMLSLQFYLEKGLCRSGTAGFYAQYHTFLSTSNFLSLQVQRWVSSRLLKSWPVDSSLALTINGFFPFQVSSPIAESLKAKLCPHLHLYIVFSLCLSWHLCNPIGHQCGCESVAEGIIRGSSVVQVSLRASLGLQSLCYWCWCTRWKEPNLAFRFQGQFTGQEIRKSNLYFQIRHILYRNLERRICSW